MKRSSTLSVCLFVAVATAPAALPAQTPTFSAPKQISTGVPSGDIASVFLQGNFNGNGNADLIASFYNPNNPSNTSFEFLTGDGTGNFSATGPANVVQQDGTLVADVNGDGKDDIITLMGGCQYAPCSNNPNKNGDGIISVLLSQGNGVFTKGYGGTLPSGLPSVEAVVADFNKDGKPDIAVLAFANGPGNYTAPAELCIFLNQGNGTFTQTDYQTPAGLGNFPKPTNLVSGDFEGNGNQDIALVFNDTQGSSDLYPELLTFAGDGKGSFGPGVVSYAFDSGVNFWSFPPFNNLFAADLNGDGRTDLVTSLFAKNNPETGNLRVPSLLANVSGKFYWDSAVYLPHPPVTGITFLLDDFNGDGKPDLFYYYADSTDAIQAGFYLGLGNGAFKTPHTPLAIGGEDEELVVETIRLKTGDLPSIIYQNELNEPGIPIELLVNTTTK